MRIFIAAVAAVFMYHHVAPSAPPGTYGRALTVSPEEFAAQLAWLRGRGCLLVRASILVRDALGGTLASCEVALTFDDGYDDAANIAAPLLEGDHAVGTFFIATGSVGTAGHVSIAQLRRMNEQGMEIAAHTVHHVDLTLASASVRSREIDASVAMLQAWTGAPVTDFAYPSGRYNAAVESAARADGLLAAFTTKPGRLGPHALGDVFALPRYRVLHGTGLALLRSVLGVTSASLAPLGMAGDAAAGVRALSDLERATVSIARERAEGNDMPTAESIGVRLLRDSYPEPIEKVRVLSVPPAVVAGIMLSGSGLHAPVTPAQFEADAREMAVTALDAAKNVDEVDVWAVVPQAVPKGATVAGDLALPTDRTVFSIAVRRAGTLGAAFVDAAWAADLMQRDRAWQN